jgi:hypothetical protein
MARGPLEWLPKILQQGVATTHWGPLSLSGLFCFVFALAEPNTAQQSQGRPGQVGVPSLRHTPRATGADHELSGHLSSGEPQGQANKRQDQTGSCHIVEFSIFSFYCFVLFLRRSAGKKQNKTNSGFKSWLHW